MANIIDGLEQATHRETVELLATIETYTLWTRLTVFAKGIQNLFLKLIRKEYAPTGMQVQFKNTESVHPLMEI